MARRRRPTRTLLGFFIGLALAYGEAYLPAANVRGVFVQPHSLADIGRAESPRRMSSVGIASRWLRSRGLRSCGLRRVVILVVQSLLRVIILYVVQV